MLIRPYRLADYPSCMQAFDSNCPDFFADHERAEFEQLLHSLPDTKIGENASGTYYDVVEMDGLVVACAGFFLPDGDEPAMLVWGMVSRDYHKKGIGEKLLKHRLNRLQELRPGTQVLLDTTQLSYGFFKKAGFTVFKITPDFYAPGLDRYDMVWVPPTSR